MTSSVSNSCASMPLRAGGLMFSLPLLLHQGGLGAGFVAEPMRLSCISQRVRPCSATIITPV